ncbi:MAG TPA: 16S rRNA (uracil(1498)-N(3))-methyltransferase [Firmicutes bacterium]|nr:16S rRNA (uracil(1498)-N(3))-methyltransferase [Bacillota bacterium]
MAAPKRFFAQNISEEMTLSEEEGRHAKNVLRLAEGDEVTLFDGSGKEYSAVVTRADRQGITVHVVRENVSDREPKTWVFLLIGALKGDKTELVVQKATELGVSRIGVFSSRYCSAYMNENKLERLNRVAREAAKQCLRASVPRVEYYETLEEALRAGSECVTRLFACEFLDETEKDLIDTGATVCAVVGSEGGFAEEEYALAQRLGYCGVSLGKRILRAETAAIALLSVVMHEAGELG